jgi:DME family drug/metabolite transporter
VTSPPAPLSTNTGRLLVVGAAVMWSLSGAFMNVLVEPTALGLHSPKLGLVQISAFRVLFAGLVILPLVRPRDVRFRWTTLFTALMFAAMNATYLTALGLGQAANAVLMQYTAPLWIFLVGVGFLGERVNWRGVVSLLIATAGIAVILVGGWQGGKLVPILLGLGSGVGFAAVVLGLRAQRDISSAWLTAVNHLFAAVVLLPFGLPIGLVDVPWPTWSQLGWLVLFGVVQMGVPYLLIARGLKSVSSQEAGALTLLEPLLMPLWAWLVAPDKERFTAYIGIGGALILIGLACRYLPGRPEPQVGEPGT